MSQTESLSGLCLYEPTDQSWEYRSMLFRDPDGNLIAVTPSLFINSTRNNAIMRKSKIAFWTITGLISFFMLFSAGYSGTHKVEFAHLGFPEYFRIELTTAKIIGALALLIPQVPARIREWIYVAFGINLISAAIAKYYSGYPISGVIEPLFVLIIMIALAVYLNRLSKVTESRNSRHAPA
jgi:DoxX-like family